LTFLPSLPAAVRRAIAAPTRGEAAPCSGGSPAGRHPLLNGAPRRGRSGHEVIAAGRTQLGGWSAQAPKHDLDAEDDQGAIPIERVLGYLSPTSGPI
jgi:hypothetical protein